MQKLKDIIMTVCYQDKIKKIKNIIDNEIKAL
jgi:hypothetical protein